MHYKCLQTTCNEKLAKYVASYTHQEKNTCKQHLFRAICSQATKKEDFVDKQNSLRAKRSRTICLKSKLLANYQYRAS